MNYGYICLVNLFMPHSTTKGLYTYFYKGNRIASKETFLNNTYRIYLLHAMVHFCLNKIID